MFTIKLKISRVSTHVPTSCASFPNDIFRQDETFLTAKFTHIIRFREMSEGGHFPATQVPKILAEDIVASFVELEDEGLADFDKKHTCRINGPN